MKNQPKFKLKKNQNIENDNKVKVISGEDFLIGI